MATIAAATAGDVSGAEKDSLLPGRMLNTAGVPAGNGASEGTVRNYRKYSIFEIYEDDSSNRIVKRGNSTYTQNTTKIGKTRSVVDVLKIR